MARETWTDERLDDLTKRMDEGFGEVKGEQRQQREEMARQKDMDAKFQAQQKYMDAKFDALNRTMQIGFWLIGSFLVGLMGMFATQL